MVLLGFTLILPVRPHYKVVRGTSKIVMENVKFPYGQETIDWALDNQQALSYRFVYKKGKWYIFCTTNQIEIPYQSHLLNGAIGVDFNPNLVGWSFIDREGNLRDKGQISFNLADRRNEQTTATIGDVCKVLVDLAIKYQCPLVIEKLDFQKKKAALGEKGAKYARMLSNESLWEIPSNLSQSLSKIGN